VRQRDLVKHLNENDLVQALPGGVKIAAPGLETVKAASKQQQKKKKKAKAKGRRQAD
jgi:hypothetical protein